MALEIRLTAPLVAAMLFACQPAVAGQPRSIATVPFTSLTVTYAPVRASRHLTLRSVSSVPAEGLVVPVNCMLRWGRTTPFCWAPGKSFKALCVEGGRPRDCWLDPDPVKDPLLKAAVQLADDYEFDPADLPTDSEAPRLTIIPVKLDPADIVALAPPNGEAVLPMDAVSFLRRPIQYPLEERYSGGHGQVSVVCQIQADGRLLCGDATSMPKPGHFASVPVQIERYWRAAPQLANGTPSAGRWVQISIAFRFSSHSGR